MNPDKPARRARTALTTILAAAAACAALAAPASAEYGLEFLDVRFLNQDGTPATQAGSHPYAMETSFEINNDGNFAPLLEGKLKDIVVEQLTGFVGDATMPRCSAADFLAPHPVSAIAADTNKTACPDNTAIGIADIDTISSGNPFRSSAVHNLVPSPGVAASLGFRIRGVPAVVNVVPKDTPGYNIVASSLRSNAAVPVIRAKVLLWGVPANPAHDFHRGSCIQVTGGRYRLGKIASDDTTAPSLGQTWFTCPSNATPRPLLTLPRSCDSSIETHYRTTSWEQPNNWVTGSTLNRDSAGLLTGSWVGGYPEPGAPQPFTGCGSLEFEPQLDARPTASSADGASGYSFELDFDHSRGLTDPDGITQSDLKGATVTLPEGLTVNPSSATGLDGCSDAEFGLHAGGEPRCPDAAKIGTVEVTSPLLDEELDGEMILLDPLSTDPASGDMFRGGLVIRNAERGVLVKVVGKVVVNPQTGRITASFDDNPQLPFDHLKVNVKGGPQGALALPQRCGPAATSTTMTPWSGNAPVLVNTPFAVGGDCSFGFAPSLAAGMDAQTARSHGRFAFKFSRRDGEQWLRGLTARLPKGLLASVKHVDLCTNAQADAGACPVGSQIGVVDAKAGSGDPFVLEQKGQLFLTEGYKGGEYGLAVKIRPVAGPFRGQWELSPIVVRQAIHVDRKTAQVTAVSDPFPLIHHGIPLRVREVLVNVDRPNFMLNPSDCSPKQVGATILSAEGTRADAANRFQAANCATLPFRPRLALRLVGRKQVTTGKHPAIRAAVRQRGVGEAGIQRAEVRLPKSLALDVNNAQALCEFEDGTEADPESHCPRGSIIGRARAVSPLLKQPLVGPVFFVKNIRVDPNTGNEIRTLPMLVVALRGEVNINLKGESDVKGGKLVNTFADVPDAPISQFNMNIKGGRNGILAVTRTRRSRLNLCRMGRQVAEADMDGQNGKRHDFNVVMRKPCPRRATPAQVCRKRTNDNKALRACVRRVKHNRAKRAAAQRAAKRKAARRAAIRRNS